MNPKLASLQAYPFQRLAKLIEGITPAAKSPIVLSIGEPKHPAPPFVLEALAANLNSVSVYPTTRGLPELRESIAAWANRRFDLQRQPLDPDRHVLPACGTREALFSVAQAVVDRDGTARPVVIMPNPFYQIYEGAALLAGAEPYFLNTLPPSYRMALETLPDDVLRRTQLVYTCSPGNPTGSVMGREDYVRLLALAERHDFVIAADECYSELYFEESRPPLGLLQVANELGIADYRRCLVFHSLSKRSNVPGMRSGFIAGDGALMQRLFDYRTYHGCTMPGPVQRASIVAWRDEAHVRENRTAYREKFDAVLGILGPILPVERPQASFYLWPQTPVDDEHFTRELYRRENVLVLPGRYLSREAGGLNPGRNRVRMALVASLDECREAAERIRVFVQTLS
jgi:N-succinyldiaminopimelate aminotransferase